MTDFSNSKCTNLERPGNCLHNFNSFISIHNELKHDETRRGAILLVLFFLLYITILYIEF